MVEPNLVQQGMISVIRDTEAVTSTFNKREFVIVTDGQYPQEVKFELTQDRCDLLDKFKVNDIVHVYFNLRGRSWKKDESTPERYFVSLNAWRIEKAQEEDHPNEWEEPQAEATDEPLPF